MLTLVLLSLIATQTTSVQCPGPGQSGPLSLTIAMFDYASVSPGELAGAKDQLSRIYCEIGIRITWWAERPASHRSADADSTLEDDGLVPKDALVVAIRPESAWAKGHFSPDVLGVATGDAANRGRMAYIFYDRLQQGRGLHRGEILGYFMAHEIGHLLLPFLSHSRQGIMRAQWDTRDLELAESGRLAFTPEQVDQMRSRVVERVKP